MREVSEAILEVLHGGRRAALATVVEVKGSAPQRAGARLLLEADGRTVGTVGGGAVESAVLEALARCLTEGTPRLLQWALEEELGMACGGAMSVFVEPVEGLPRLVIFGAGHVALPTAALARRVGFRVTVVDDRPEQNTGDRFPGCERLVASPGQALTTLGLTERDWVLVLTRDHRRDAEALAGALKIPLRYVGLIGSRRKVRMLQAELRQQSPDLPGLGRLHAPVGLDLGATTPEELAVSLVAQLVAVRHGRPGGHLASPEPPDGATG